MILLQQKINNGIYFFGLENGQNYCNSNPHLSLKAFLLRTDTVHCLF